MARGDKAKIKIAAKLQEMFGDNYIGEVAKKHYVWADDGGERVQISISLTCPKTFIDAGEAAAVAAPFDWSGTSEPAPAPAAITEKEKETLEDLIKRLGL